MLILIDFERELGTPLTETRNAVVAALREQRCTITSDQVTSVTAERGSQFSAATMQFSDVPIGISAWFTQREDRIHVAVRICDRWNAPLAQAWGVQPAYEQALSALYQRVDAYLAKLDSAAAPTFSQPRWWTATPAAGRLGSVNLASGAFGKVARKTGAFLEGRSKRKTPPQWAYTQYVAFYWDDGSVSATVEQTQAYLTVAVLVASQDGSLPANLAADVAQFSAKIETALKQPQNGIAWVYVSESEKPVFEFLEQQATMREKLPMRTRHVCLDCRCERIVNPDYRRLAERNRKMQAFGGGIGATLYRGGISPFVLVGTLMRVRRTDPDFVCPRCQGLHADTSVVTFCPGCGRVHKQAVLRKCDCGYDFRQVLGVAPVTAEAPGQLQPAATGV